MTAAATFRCPLCADAVHVVMRRTGYCLNCDRRTRRRNALLHPAATR